MKVKEESEKVVLKLNIHKTKIMASDPITSWEIDGETVETGLYFIWGAHALEKEMTTHSSILAWKNFMDRGRLKSMGSQRVGHS